MEATRNLCAQVPVSLHEKVTEERSSTISETVCVLTGRWDWSI